MHCCDSGCPFHETAHLSQLATAPVEADGGNRQTDDGDRTVETGCPQLHAAVLRAHPGLPCPRTFCYSVYGQSAGGVRDWKGREKKDRKANFSFHLEK